MKLYNATITYRGWAGHFICSDRCLFRLNTLIEHNGESVVVSTVGNMYVGGKIDTIGHRRYYETMAFSGKQNGPYIEVDVDHYVPFESEWQICADNAKDLPKDVDNIASAMHSAVVDEIAKRSLIGNLYEVPPKLTRFTFIRYEGKGPSGILRILAQSEDEARSMIPAEYHEDDAPWKVTHSQPDDEIVPGLIQEFNW